MFVYTQHALEKMDALGIEKWEVEKAVKTGLKWKEEKTGKWHAQLAGIEVVIVKEEEILCIITAYLAARSK